MSIYRRRVPPMADPRRRLRVPPMADRRRRLRAHAEYIASDAYRARAAAAPAASHDVDALARAMAALEREMTFHVEKYLGGHGDEDHILHVAGKYRTGLHPYLRPRRDLALRLYALLTEENGCQARTINTAAHEAASPVPDEDVDPRAIDFSESFGEVLLAEAPRKMRDAAARRRVIPLPVPPGHVDPQNVHDRFVRRATDENVRDLLVRFRASAILPLQRFGDALSADSWACGVRRAFLRECEGLSDLGPYMTDIRRVVPTLTTKEYAGCSEIELLEAVRWHISTCADAAKRENLTVTLGMQVASAVERGHVVCSTGKKTRIASVLQAADEPGRARTVDLTTFRQEAMALAARMRADFSRGDRGAAYEDGDDAAAEELRSLFVSELRGTYDPLVPAVPAELVDMIVREARDYF